MKERKGREGTALVVVVSFLLLSTILSGALLTANSSQARVVASQLNVEKATYVAEAGVENAAQYVESQQGYVVDGHTGTANIGEGQYTYVLTKTGWRQYQLSSIGTVNGKAREITIDRLYLPTYAQFALWMHENGEIYFIPGEEFFGHVHANDKLWFYSNAVEGGPIFWEELTSAWDSYGGVADWAEFHQGFELNAAEGQMAEIDFDTGPFSLESLAGTFGLVLEGETTVTFEGETVRITNERMGWNDHPYPIGDDQLIYVSDATSGSDSTKKGRVYVQGGSLDGRITIVGEDDILINDHVQYSSDPLDNPDADDALGLISKDDVWVTQAAPDNLEIDAAIIAAGVKAEGNRGSFGVLCYWCDAPRGALNVNGSIVQDKRGAVGTFNDDGMVSGYYKNYSFDHRFESTAPPYYPVVDDKVQFEGWKEGPLS